MNDIFQQALDALDIELGSLNSMRLRMGKEVVLAVQLMLETRGRVVVLGMGKSGIVGKKIAATLASTGTPAFLYIPERLSMEIWERSRQAMLLCSYQILVKLRKSSEFFRF